jgi:sulfatase modifying factor 1
MEHRNQKPSALFPILWPFLMISLWITLGSSCLVQPTEGPGTDAPVPINAQALRLPHQIRTPSGLTMQFIPGGTFVMGLSQEGFEALWPNRVGLEFFQNKVYPPHRVTLSPYLLGTTEVTQKFYQGVTGSNRSDYVFPQNPVEHVSWFDAVEFCNRLSELEGLSPYYIIRDRHPETGYPITEAEVSIRPEGEGYRLPTEAQWEYAARGGRETIDLNSAYAGSADVDLVSWHKGNSPKGPNPVALKAPNDFGLYDMAGNLWEWTGDWYGPYPVEDQVNPTGPPEGSKRVDRGGSCNYRYPNHRSATRGNKPPWVNNNVMGFRVALPLGALKVFFLSHWGIAH